MSAPKKGKKLNWSGIYASDRPQSIIGLTQAQEATIKQAIGFVGKDQEGVSQTTLILVYKGSDALTLTDYATAPVDTVILAPKLGKIYFHTAQSDPAVVGDWFEATGTQVT